MLLYAGRMVFVFGESKDEINPGHVQSSLATEYYHRLFIVPI